MLKKSQQFFKFIFYISFLLIIFGCNIFKRNPVSTGYTSNLAILGYDPVAYYTLGKAKKGNQQYMIVHRGLLWQFQNPYHMFLFEQNPNKWIGFNGYDAYELAYNEFVIGNPRVWTVHNGKIYFFQNKKNKVKWSGNLINYVRQANYFWSVTSFKKF